MNRTGKPHTTETPDENRVTIEDAQIHDAITDAIMTLAGIGEALAYRTAVYRDEMLELLARDADMQATALRELIDAE